MTSKDAISRDLGDVSDELLSDLSAVERVRLFATAAAQNNDEWIETIWETAPRKTYEMPDAASRSGARTVFLLSTLANNELTHLKTELRVHEARRDRAVALVLLNEALSRLSGGQFSVDAFGPTTLPDSWPDGFGPQYDPETSTLATKFQALWDATPLTFAVSDEERPRPYFPELVANALLAYRTDLSHEEFDDVPPFLHSEVYLSEVRLIRTITSYYRSFHTWRLLAEESLGISFDEFVGVTQPDTAGEPVATLETVDEDHCELIVSLYQPYLDAHADVSEALYQHAGEEFDGVPDLDAEAEARAAELAAEIELLS